MQPTAEGESQKVKLKVRVNIHGIITVASASLLEKKQDSAQNENVEMENANENAQAQEAPMETNGSGQEQNGLDNQEVREGGGEGEQHRQSWTQRVGQWFSGVCDGSAFVSQWCLLPPVCPNVNLSVPKTFRISGRSNKHHDVADPHPRPRPHLHCIFMK